MKMSRSLVALPIVLTVACSGGTSNSSSNGSSATAPCAKAIAAGFNHTCALTTAGGVRCWGDNSSGQLGDGTSANSRSAASDTDVLTGVSAVAAGYLYTCAVMTTGGVRCWGDNYSGQLGDGTTTNNSTPPSTDVLAGAQALALAGGSEYTCALMTAGGVRCWGDNYNSALGDGTTNSRFAPPDTDVLTGVQAIATGDSHACALMTTGGVRCWGVNSSGQLGDGTGTYSEPTPPSSDVLAGVRAIAAGGSHTCALMIAGGVRCWGYNGWGQLGDGTTTNRSTPPDTDVLTDVQAIAASKGHTCALTTTGGVRCWGQNDNGELGDGTTNDRFAPPIADVLTGAQAIAAGGIHTCALMTTGGVQCWGYDYGTLGGGNVGARVPTTPTPVTGICQ